MVFFYKLQVELTIYKCYCQPFWLWEIFKNQDWVTQPSIKIKCQLKFNWHLNLPKLYMNLIYT
jgi:hypothetical protein